MDTQKIRQLLDQRDAIDAQLKEVIGGEAPKKEITCSKCKTTGHTARTCPQREYDDQKV